MKYFLAFCRLFVGSLFIVSGLIKANDTLGFSYKLEEYFHESALNLPFFEPWALELAILACVGEIILGFALLFGAKMRLATLSLLALTVFFGWLTLYTANCDPSATYTTIVNGEEVVKSVTCVTDCGCFGDAMKGSIGRSLTPWESFYKDLVLFIFLLPVLIMQFVKGETPLNTDQDDKLFFPLSLLFVGFFSYIFTWFFPVFVTAIGYAGYFLLRRWKGNNSQWFSAAWITILAFGICYWTYNHLPIRDYRPYAVGKNIEEGMKSAEELGLQPPKYGYIYTMKNKSTGEQTEISDAIYIEQKWWEKPEWEMVSDLTRQIKISDGYEPPIHDFVLFDNDGNDRTYSLLGEERVFLLFAYDIKKTDGSVMAKVNELAEAANQAGVTFIGLTAGTYDDVNNFRHDNQTQFPFWSGDGTVLKTVIRSNPGLVELKKGTVVGKWHANDLPSASELF
ncbi:DoxX family protein [bacterium SCSIO 12741]|nr:DoxX family protein [bacterium SCSIO 12741]